MIFKNIFCLVFFTLFVSSSSFYDIELPLVSPSDTSQKVFLREDLTESILKVQNTLSNLNLSDEQKTNLGTVLQAHTKARAAMTFSLDLFKVEKGFVIFRLLEVLKGLHPSLPNVFEDSVLCGDRLGCFNQYFEFNFPQGYKELEALCGKKDIFEYVARCVEKLSDPTVYWLNQFNCPNPEGIVLKAKALKTEIEKSRFNLESIESHYTDIFEPFQDELGIPKGFLQFFVIHFVRHALFLFYKENFRTPQEISNVLFGPGSKLRDLEGNLLSEKFGPTDLHSEVARLADGELDDAKKLLPPNHPLSDDLKKKLLDSLFGRFSKHKSQSDMSDPQNPLTSDPQKSLASDNQNPPDNNYLKLLAVLIIVALVIIVGLAIFFIRRRKSINS